MGDGWEGVNILGISIRGTIDPTMKLVSFVNPYSLVELYKSDISKEELSSLVFYSDGIFICWISYLFFGVKVCRYSFDYTSLASQVFSEANDKRELVEVVGGGSGVAERFSSHILGRYDSISLGPVRGGYFQSNEELFAYAESIRDRAPDLVIIGMGAVMQERMLLALKKVGFKGRAYTCGGFLDQTVAAGGDYYPSLVNALNIRWLYRIIKEPRRLLVRYVRDYSRFLYLFLLERKSGLRL